SCGERQDCTSQPAGAGPDLDDGGILQRTGTARYLLGQVEVEQEILAERLLRVQTVPLDDFSQGRQPVQCRHYPLTFADFPASSAASLSASTRLLSRATPCPARPKAVP